MRGFLVLGPESTGTRLATRILIAGGCQGSAEHNQPFDALPVGSADPVVLRRSVPHGRSVTHPQPNEWLSLASLRDRFASGREMQAVVTVRDWWCTARSQVAHDHASDEAGAYANIRRAYQEIFTQLTGPAGMPYCVLVYESLILHPRRVQSSLLSHLCLRVGNFVEIYDGDEKYLRWPPGRGSL